MKNNDSKNRMVTRNPYFSSTIKADEIVMYEVLQEALIYLTHLCLILILFENNFCDSFIKKVLFLLKSIKLARMKSFLLYTFQGLGGPTNLIHRMESPCDCQVVLKLNDDVLAHQRLEEGVEKHHTEKGSFLDTFTCHKIKFRWSSLPSHYQV